MAVRNRTLKGAVCGLSASPGRLRDGSSGCLLGFITLDGAAEKMVD
jgi:hypothetical protein